MSPRRVAKALAAFGAVALLVLLVVAVWVVRSRNHGLSLQQVADLMPNSLLHAKNFHWTQMKAGERQWVLNASEASYAADRGSLILTDAVVTMMSTDGKQVVVNAPHAALALTGNHVTRADLSGGTVIHYGDFLLTTDSAVFLPDEDRVEATGPVTLEGEGIKVTGVGMTGHPKTRVFQLHQQVKTEITPKHESEDPKTS